MCSRTLPPPQHCRRHQFTPKHLLAGIPKSITHTCASDHHVGVSTSTTNPLPTEAHHAHKHSQTVTQESMQVNESAQRPLKSWCSSASHLDNRLLPTGKQQARVTGERGGRGARQLRLGYVHTTTTHSHMHRSCRHTPLLLSHAVPRSGHSTPTCCKPAEQPGTHNSRAYTHPHTCSAPYPLYKAVPLQCVKIDWAHDRLRHQ